MNLATQLTLWALLVAVVSGSITMANKEWRKGTNREIQRFLNFLAVTALATTYFVTQLSIRFIMQHFELPCYDFASTLGALAIGLYIGTSPVFEHIPAPAREATRLTEGEVRCWGELVRGYGSDEQE